MTVRVSAARMPRAYNPGNLRRLASPDSRTLGGQGSRGKESPAANELGLADTIAGKQVCIRGSFLWSQLQRSAV